MRILARRVLQGLYLLFLVPLLLGLFARYLPMSWFWWTGLFSPAVPYLGIALVLWTPVVLWKLPVLGRVIHMLVLLLLFLRFIPLERLTSAPEVSEDDLVIMTFNSPVRGPNPDTLSKEMLALVAQEQPDLLALQEPVIWLERSHSLRRATSHVQALIDSLAYWAPTPSASGKRFDIEQPVLGRFPFSQIKQVTLPATNGSVGPTHFTRTQFQWKGRDAVIYNLHLHTIGEKKPWQEQQPRPFDPRFWNPYLRQFRDAFMRRGWEVQQVRDLIEKEELPVIVVGDLNSTIHHREYFLLSRGLRNAFTTRGRGWGSTYHANLPLVRIDHILVSPEWEIISSDVPERSAFSDHLPVTTRLRWRE